MEKPLQRRKTLDAAIRPPLLLTPLLPRLASPVPVPQLGLRSPRSILGLRRRGRAGVEYRAVYGAVYEWDECAVVGGGEGGGGFGEGVGEVVGVVEFGEECAFGGEFGGGGLGGG